jgi:hypothetical protein
VKDQGATVSAATFAIAAPASRPGWRSRLTAVNPHGNRHMAHIERRRIQRRDSSGRLRIVTRYRVRYRDESGKQHCETKTRVVDAERRKAEIEVALAGGTWRDPRRGEMPLHEWVEQWLPTRHDLRATTWLGLRPPCRSRFCLASARAASRDHQQ